MKDLERENARLRRLVADLSLAGQVLADVASGNLQPPSDAGRRLLTSGMQNGLSERHARKLRS
jgi:putative transposase